MANVSEMRVVIAALEAGSFTAAGARHGLTGSAAAKLVTRVEQRIGAKLITRSTRKLTLTPEGKLYLSRMRRVLADIEETENEIASNRSDPRGPLKVTCPSFIFVYMLAAHLADFVDRFPGIQLELNVADRHIDLIGEGVDVGIRTGALADSTLITRKVCDLYRGLYAAPRYLKRRGVPHVPEDLAQHECIYSTHGQDLDLWPFKDENGVRMVKVNNRLGLNDAVACFQAGLSGLGIIHISDMLATERVARGELVPVLSDHYYSKPVPVSLVMLPGRQRTARVSAFVEFFVERFSAAPWRAVSSKPSAKAQRNHRRAK
jgi:DNA-binding transcriptional LysR family regulator